MIFQSPPQTAQNEHHLEPNAPGSQHTARFLADVDALETNRNVCEDLLELRGHIVKHGERFDRAWHVLARCLGASIFSAAYYLGMTSFVVLTTVMPKTETTASKIAGRAIVNLDYVALVGSVENDQVARAKVIFTDESDMMVTETVDEIEELLRLALSHA